MTRPDTGTPPVAPNPGAGASARWDAASALAREYRSLEGALGAALRVSRVSGLCVGVVAAGERRWVLVQPAEDVEGIESRPGAVAVVLATLPAP